MQDTIDKSTENMINDSINNSNKFFNWVQSFTKKIVTVTFLLFVIFQIFNLILIYMEYRNGELMYLDTFITESNETFRVVIGGYIVKAACENTVKIISSIITKYMNYKYNQSDDIEEEEMETF